MKTTIKIWTSKQPADDKIVAITKNCIYKANPPASEVEGYVFDLQMGNPPRKKSFEIPFSYLSVVSMQEGKNFIEIIFRGDTDHLVMSDSTQKQEIFDFLRLTLPNATYSLVKYSWFASAKKQLIAMAVITVIYLLSAYLALGIESGEQYDVTGKHYDSIAGIILALAYMGIFKLSLLFGGLLLIIILGVYKKKKNPFIAHRLVLKN